MNNIRQYLTSSLFLNCISLIAVLGSLAYLTVGLTVALRFIVLVLALSIGLWIEHTFPRIQSDLSPRNTFTKLERGIVILYLVLVAGGVVCLMLGRSDRPLITPWETVSPVLFGLYGLASLLLYFLKNKLSVLLLIIHYSWSFSIFLFVYVVGYGFDPFIHEASIKAIEAAGKIQPTTVYYLGQYSLVTVFHALLGSSVAVWSKLLVPVLAALSIPLALIKAFGKEKKLLSVGLGLLIFSFACFTVTTPQNLAYLWLTVAILWSLRADSPRDRIVIWLLALAALCTQPIAGIPAVLLAASLSVEKFPKHAKAYAGWIMNSLYLLILPLAFYFFNGNGQAGLVWPDLSLLFENFLPTNPVTENWWLNFLYLFANSRVLIYVLLSLAGLLLAYRAKDVPVIKRYAFPALGLVLSSIVAMSIDFSYLIAYERADYPTRLLVVAAIFALPLVISAIKDIFIRLNSEPRNRQAVWYIFFSVLAAASLYLAYPRFDHYHNSRGYATSSADLAAVRWIEMDAGSSSYIALANQQVSAAALRQAGFKTYYHGDMFYYPIPTGGPLYTLYLDMLNAPKRETMIQAMDLAGVNSAYFVVNDYWWAADKIIDEAKQNADDFEIISEGQVMVFRYRR